MHATPTFRRTSSSSMIVAAVLATVISMALLTAVAFLFQRDGKPLEALAAAEQACVQHAYVSERELCMRDRLAARSNVASK